MCCVTMLVTCLSEEVSQSSNQIQNMMEHHHPSCVLLLLVHVTVLDDVVRALVMFLLQFRWCDGWLGK